MKRDMNQIVRDLESKRNNDIIYKKNKVGQILRNDPDILEALGEKEKLPLNSYADPEHPTEEELNERHHIMEYNEQITHERIIPWLKLNNIQKEVLNFIMYDIEDSEVSYSNNVIKIQYLIFMVLVHENDMMTEFGITRPDLVDYLIRDQFNWSNILGSQLKLEKDYVDIIDNHYYARTIKFRIETANGVSTTGYNNYDRFSKI